MDLSNVPEWVMLLSGGFTGVGVLSVLLYFAKRINKRHHVAGEIAAILEQHGFTKLPAILRKYQEGDLRGAAASLHDLRDELKNPKELAMMLDSIFDKHLETKLRDPEFIAFIRSKIPQVAAEMKAQAETLLSAAAKVAG